MKDENKTKEQLLKELTEARQRIAELEILETELKRAGEKRVATLKVAADMIELMSDGVAITDMEGKVIDTNRAVTEQIGYTKEELIGKTPLEVCVGESERVKVFEALIKMFSGEPISAAEYEVIRKDGSKFPVLVDISILKDSTGNPIAAIVIYKDITERKRMEQQLEERELAILRLIANGTTTKEIGDQLSLSEATIKRDVRLIFDKLGVRNRSEAVAEAYKRQLV